ncbi:ATP-binding protein [Streptomyces marianii]|nr:ATP-binding protein [Streptomyces marianii]
MSAPTTFGTGVMFTERPVLPASVPGLYLRHRDRGFTAHVTASEHALSTVRRLAASVLMSYGADREAAATAQLVLSELVGNAVRACGPAVPLVIEVYVTALGIAVNVHDPAPELLPHRSETPMDSDQATSGRGLALLDLLAPGWTIEHSLIGKQIRCHLAE